MSKKAVVAGHICIDLTPMIPEQGSVQIQDILSPGKLLNVSGIAIHTGGVVSNTGLAMKKLGADVVLAGKIGNDAFGDMAAGIIGQYGSTDGLIRSADSTSYSIVLAFPGVDRIILHNPGANDTFCADDLPMDVIRESALFHFGYPPHMKRMFENEGAELIRMMRLVREAGTVTSLDMSMVDPKSEAGQVDWRSVLEKTLPYVDIFAPSVEELTFMLDRDAYRKIKAKSSDADFTELLDIEADVEPLGRACLELGAKIVLIKCGAPGLYYCTAGEQLLRQIGEKTGIDAAQWADRKGFEQSFVPDRVLSGIGAGDTCVAAFLTAVLEGCSLEKSVQYASATGACCVAAYDALSGLKSFGELDRKIAGGWKKANCYNKQ